MANSDNYVAFVLDQLSDIEELTSRPMFGGLGLYSDALFFGIIFSDILYFKVNEKTRGAYEREGAKPFKPYAGRPTTMHYYEVPGRVLEDGEELTKWARRAIRAARDKANP